MRVYSHEEIKAPIAKVARPRKERIDLSPSQFKAMLKEFEAQFVQPRPLPELDGELGVSLLDIANSLGVTHSDLRRKLDRTGELGYLTSANFKVKTFVFRTPDNKAVESYLLESDAAEQIVARYNNLKGRIYLSYLIRCKSALTASLGELEKNVEEIDRLRKKLAAAAEKQSEAQKKLRAKAKHKVVVGEEFSTYDSEGLKKVAKVTEKTLDEMTNTERGLYNIQQNTRKQLGCHEKIIRLLIEHKCSDKQILHEADLCLDALESFNSLVNKTGLERALEPKKEYIQRQLIDTGEKPKYIK